MPRTKLLFSALRNLARIPGSQVVTLAGIRVLNYIKKDNLLIETPTLAAFHHPEPGYPVHILVVPKRLIKDISEISKADNQFLIDLFETVSNLVGEYNLEEGGYRLVVNGGKNQDIPLLHFHLIAGD